jgi:hypothetical protein
MCDYSLEHVASRPAAVADRMIVTRFRHTVTRGFAGAGDMNTAVCLRPGTEIAFDREPRYERILSLWRKTARSKVARFRQVDMQVPHVHHDALEFADGTIVLLAQISPGQWATVLQLPSVPIDWTGRVETPSRPVEIVSSGPTPGAGY